jgi:hypothetical protein
VDTALILEQKFDCKQITTYEEASELLDKSLLIHDLLGDFDFTVLNLLHRLNELAKIPFTNQIEKVKDWVIKLADIMNFLC